jgi:mono/diheme cytochrome c family protein
MNFVIKTLATAAALAGLACASSAHAETPADMLARYGTAAKAAADPARGQQFFTSTHGHEWSCSSCHGALPVKEGKHASTGKVIQPMAPAFNAERFTDSAKTEKWFRRNCNDVVGRECTAGEKADLIAWLLTLKA